MSLVGWLLAAVAFFVVLFLLKKRQRTASSRTVSLNWDYVRLKEVLLGRQLPAMIVDVKALNENIDEVVRMAKGSGHTVRIATKSVRVPELIKHILERGQPVVKGLMCYSATEAEFLFNEFGLDDIMIAYPSVQEDEIRRVYEITRRGASVHIMVDSIEHVRIIDNIVSQFGLTDQRLKICIDVDVSYRPFGLFHFGVLRSPCHTLDSFKLIVDALQKSKHLTFSSVMAYEALLSAPDRRPSDPLMNLVLPILKRLSWPDVMKKRKSISDYLTNTQTKIEFFNGGGTSTILNTREDPSCTEIAVGSGFLQSQIFDYHNKRMNTNCAFLFGLRVTRIPAPGVVTCQSGGFIASGPAGKLSEPTIFLPRGLSLNPNEGCGEVQTPIYVHGFKLEVNDPVFFRPAKAGEIAENFNEYILLTEDGKTTFAKTYRGFGKRFF